MESGTMRTARLGDTGIETSVLGFGCADLFREPDSARRRRLFEAAVDAGIRHFDAAPMYGLGLVEGELGRFAQGRRDRLVIATKFGITPAPAARALARAQAPIRRLFEALPALRGQARPSATDPRSGAVGAVLYRASGYDARAARSSLERSLRELRTEYVDVLFLHDPRPGEVRSDDVRDYMESARAAGRIRAWGVAGEPESVVEAVHRLGGGVPILQLRGDIFERALRRVPLGTPTTILFGAIGRALPRILAHIRSDEAVRGRWSETIGVDCGRTEEVGSLLLRDALRENNGGPVLFSTTHPARIPTAVAATEVDAESDVKVDALLALVAAELGAEVGD
jgi:D-threo-aldose 1-dehydrogenase